MTNIPSCLYTRVSRRHAGFWDANTAHCLFMKTAEIIGVAQQHVHAQGRQEQECGENDPQLLTARAVQHACNPCRTRCRRQTPVDFRGFRVVQVLHHRQSSVCAYILQHLWAAWMRLHDSDGRVALLLLPTHIAGIHECKHDTFTCHTRPCDLACGCTHARMGCRARVRACTHACMHGVHACRICG